VTTAESTPSQVENAPAETSQVKDVLERAVADPTFAQQLLDDPDTALAGYDLTEVQLLLLRSLDEEDLAKLTPENLEEFFAQESCGWCTPCWAGLHWVAKLLRDLEEGRGQLDDLDRLASHARLLAPGHTYCALAPGAAEPLQSALKYFGDDFKRHIHERRCPWH